MARKCGWSAWDLVSDLGSGFSRAAKNGFFRAAYPCASRAQGVPPILRRLRGVIHQQAAPQPLPVGGGMDFDLALECVDPTRRRGDGESAWTPTRAPVNWATAWPGPLLPATFRACIVPQPRCRRRQAAVRRAAAARRLRGASRPPAPPPAEQPASRDLFDESSDEEDATCAICLEPLGDAPRMPGCAHRFHAACVLGPGSLAAHAWADGVMPSTRRGQRVLCPLCRAPSLIPPGFL